MRWIICLWIGIFFSYFLSRDVDEFVGTKISWYEEFSKEKLLNPFDEMNAWFQLEEECLIKSYYYFQGTVS